MDVHLPLHLVFCSIARRSWENRSKKSKVKPAKPLRESEQKIGRVTCKDEIWKKKNGDGSKSGYSQLKAEAWSCKVGGD